MLRSRKELWRTWRRDGFGFAVVALAATAVTAYAAVRTTFPPPNAPFYAELGPGPNAIHDASWAAIPFYTQPSCVPSDFNLLNFFDIPRAFDCPLTVTGFSIWKNGPPPVDPAPIQNILEGTGAVHIWFVRWNELQAGMADGVLTITELQAMPSLRTGIARIFHETLHPQQAAERPLDVIIAHGELASGTRFDLEVASTKVSGAFVFYSVQISF
jgi:hypothetical protein